jgi:hypothetical protein
MVTAQPTIVPWYGAILLLQAAAKCDKLSVGGTGVDQRGDALARIAATAPSGRALGA